MLHAIEVLPRAQKQLQSIYRYLVDEFGERTTDRFQDEVETLAEMLLKYPESGHIEQVTTSSRRLYRSRIVGKYNKMVYFVSGQTLYIAAFWDMRMHPDKLKL